MATSDLPADSQSPCRGDSKAAAAAPDRKQTFGVAAARKFHIVLLALGALCLGLWKSDLLNSNHGAVQLPRETISELTYWPDIPNVELDRTQIGKEKAVIYMLCRNFELQDALESIRSVEDRFNRNYRYPWVFLNDDDWSDEFRELTSGLVSGASFYGKVEPEVWNRPGNIDEERYENAKAEMLKEDVPYANSNSYRNMCRFNSGHFFRHPLMDPYDWYWRVEPGVKFYCDQRYDPFTFLRENNKVYGFVIAIREYHQTIRTLWSTVMDFFTDVHPEYLAPENAMAFVRDNRELSPLNNTVPQHVRENPDPHGYNLCHFWSNFEIGSLNFFRSKKYIDFFNHLDNAGGFYYERWGDAPVHTLALVAMANRTQIHHFSDIGYFHEPFHRCPHDEASYLTGRCLCPEYKATEIDFDTPSCLPLWLHHAGHQFLFQFGNPYQVN